METGVSNCPRLILSAIDFSSNRGRIVLLAIMVEKAMPTARQSAIRPTIASRVPRTSCWTVSAQSPSERLPIGHQEGELVSRRLTGRARRLFVLLMYADLP